MSEELIATQLDVIKQHLDAFIASFVKAMPDDTETVTTAADELIKITDKMKVSIKELKTLV